MCSAKKPRELRQVTPEAPRAVSWGDDECTWCFSRCTGIETVGRAWRRCLLEREWTWGWEARRRPRRQRLMCVCARQTERERDHRRSPHASSENGNAEKKKTKTNHGNGAAKVKSERKRGRRGWDKHASLKQDRSVQGRDVRLPCALLSRPRTPVLVRAGEEPIAKKKAAALSILLCPPPHRHHH